MCNFSNGIKFCTCGDKEIQFRDFQKVKSRNKHSMKINLNEEIPLIYIWFLHRVEKIDEDCAVVGQFIFPKEKLSEDLDIEWVLLNLNAQNSFDFDYTPTEGDNLIIQQNVILGDYLSFIYKNGQWINDFYSPLTYNFHKFFQGKLA